MALFFLPERLPSRKNTIIKTMLAPAAALAMLVLLSSTLPLTSPWKPWSFSRRSSG